MVQKKEISSKQKNSSRPHPVYRFCSELPLGDSEAWPASNASEPLKPEKIREAVAPHRKKQITNEEFELSIIGLVGKDKRLSFSQMAEVVDRVVEMLPEIRAGTLSLQEAIKQQSDEVVSNSKY